jgi:hypothetical protein
MPSAARLDGREDGPEPFLGHAQHRHILGVGEDAVVADRDEVDVQPPPDAVLAGRVLELAPDGLTRRVDALQIAGDLRPVGEDLRHWAPEPDGQALAGHVERGAVGALEQEGVVRAVPDIARHRNSVELCLHLIALAGHVRNH